MPIDVQAGNDPLGSDTVPEAPDVNDIPVLESDAEPYEPEEARKPWQELFIPIHGLIRLRAEEMRVVNHPAMQRLGSIYQLGQVNLVYRGATHRRLEHCLGTVHVAQMMVDNLRRSAESPPRVPDHGPWVFDDAITATEEVFIRLGALLHDVGHLPAGHTLEDELGLLPSHDSRTRLQLIFDRTAWMGVPMQSLRELVDQTYSDVAQGTGLAKSASEIVFDLISSNYAPGPDIGPPNPGQFRLAVCRDVIGNTICADLLDYLHRDWHHLGKPRFFDTRLLEYMEVRRGPRQSDGQLEPVVAVNLRSRDAVRTDAITLILDLLESRYQLGEVALFHRTKLSAAAMLERAVAELYDATPATRKSAWQGELVDRLLDCSDEEMLDYLQAKATELKAAKATEGAKRMLDGVSGLVTGLRLRHLHKRLYSQFDHQLSTYARRVQDLYEPSGLDPARQARNRLNALRLLEQDFALPPASLVMYCPPPSMNTKIADVRILIDGSVDTLDDYEQKQGGDRGLTGGYLNAQKARFRRLWRVYFAVKEDTLIELRSAGLLSTLLRAIDCVVLGRAVGDTTIGEAARSIATELSANPRSPLWGKRIFPASVAARSRQKANYPVGVPSLRSYAEE